MGMRAFLRRLAGLSDASRFRQALADGKGPEPTAEESIGLLDAI
jgi:hypothetical protein